MEVTPQQLEVITDIANKLAHQYSFSYYDVEDIRQEAIIFGLESLQRYDKKKAALNTFLYHHINNKLRTLKRDKFYHQHSPLCDSCVESGELCSTCKRKQKYNIIRRSLMCPLNIDDSASKLLVEDDHTERLELQEIRRLIDAELDTYLRKDYLRMLDGVTIPIIRRKRVEDAIRTIMEDKGYL